MRRSELSMPLSLCPGVKLQPRRCGEAERARAACGLQVADSTATAMT